MSTLVSFLVQPIAEEEFPYISPRAPVTGFGLPLPEEDYNQGFGPQN